MGEHDVTLTFDAVRASERVVPLVVHGIHRAGSTNAEDLRRGGERRHGPECRLWGTAEVDPPTLVRSRWLYVFQVRLSPGAQEEIAKRGPDHEDPFGGLEGRAEFLLEALTDADGLLYPMDSSQNGKPRAEQRAPAELVDASRESLVLDYVVGREVALHAAFASPFKLPPEAIELLRKAVPRDIPPTVVYLGRPQGLPRLERGGASVVGIPALDPLSLAAVLGRRHRAARDELLTTLALVASQGDAAPEKDRLLIQEYVLARNLHDLLRSIKDHSKVAKLRGLMTEQGRKQWKAAIGRVETAAKRLTAAADRAAAAVCHWLESPVWRAYELGVRLVDAEQAAEGIALGEREISYWLGNYADAIDRLDESSPGIAFLQRLAEASRDPDHPLNRHVLEPTLSWQNQFRVGRYTGKSAIALVQQLLLARAKVLGGRLDAAVAAKALNLALGEELFATGAKVSRRAFLRLPTSSAIKPDLIEVVPVASPQARLDNLKIAGLALGDVAAVLDVINAVLSIQAAAAAGEDSTRKGLDAAANTARAARAVVTQLTDASKISATTRLSLRTVGVLAAGYYAVTNAIDAGNLKARGDYHAMVGKGAAALGEGIVAWALIAGASATGVGVAGAVLAAAGYVAAIYLTDDDLDLFVAHCQWGERFGNAQNDAHHRWAGTRLLADWAAPRAQSLRMQLEAFHGLNCGFTLSFGRPSSFAVGGSFNVSPLKTLSIVHSQLDEDVRFTVRWSWKGKTSEDLTLQFDLCEVALGFTHAAYVGVSQVHGSGIHGIVWSPERRTLEVSIPQPALRARHDHGELSTLVADVSLNVRDSVFVVPPQPVTLRFISGGKLLFDQEASSKRFD